MSSNQLRILRARIPRALALAALGLLCAGGVAQAAPQPDAHESAAPPGFSCDRGEFCAWSDGFYRGDIQRFDLRTANPGDCIALPAGFAGHSFANRIDHRYVSVYQDRNCGTEGDFSTYPGGGTFVPTAPYIVRAIQIWD